MLSKRIIPCLDVKDGRVVKGINFVNLKDAGSPVEQAKVYSGSGADELVFLDITASVEARPSILEVVRSTAEQVFIPFTVGGGVRTIEDIRILLRAGADKISINTAAVENSDLIRQGSQEFGSQCIVVAVDAKRQKTEDRGRKAEDRRQKIEDGRQKTEGRRQRTERDKPKGNLLSDVSHLSSGLRWEVYTYGGRKPAGIDVIDWAKKVEALGAGEILLTSMDRDGTKTGYDLGLTKAVSEAVNIPVIASGGAGSLDDLYKAFSEGKADAVLAASIFHYGELSIPETKNYLRNRGIAVRM